MLMREAANEYKWHVNYGGIALMWRGGCIIRSRFLGKIRDAFEKNPNLHNLLLDDFFRSVIDESQAGWRRVVARAAEMGIPIPAMSSALAFFDGYRTDGCPRTSPGAARLLRRAHVRARRPTARRVLPHELDRARRPRLVNHVHGVATGDMPSAGLQAELLRR